LPKNKFGFARASSLQASPIIQLILAGTVALGIGAFGHHLHQAAPLTEEASLPAISVAALPTPAQNVAGTINAALNKSAPVLAEAHQTVQAALQPKPQSELREVELGNGETFGDLLTGAGVNRADAAAATGALQKVYDPRHLPEGLRLNLSLTRTGTDEALNGFAFQPDATREVTVARNTDGAFVANAKLVPITPRHIAAQGTINSSLYEAGAHAGVPYAVMASLIHIYSHAIDFQRDVHPGDSFQVLYEQPTTANGTPVGEAAILYAALKIGDHVKPVYRVTFNDQSVDYFDEKGQSIRRALLRTPVSAAHITSGFGMRINPILGYSKMHQGVDFGAPPGTPIFAAGNGTIADVGERGGYGRCIRIRHNGELETLYAHMSRFAANIYRGAHVNQGDVIGYVGSSGRSTGPHLHYEVHVASRPVNPLSVNLPTGRVLDGKLLAEFKKGQARIHEEFAALAAKGGFSLANATAPAFTLKDVVSCGFKGGC
jgi:murein DD-endopeptidase MepM/ murein hydrolase activator NlpD